MIDIPDFSLTKLTILWGPGLLILLGLFLLARMILNRLFRLADTHLVRLGDAQDKQAKSVERLATTLEQQVTRDSTEHKEILLTLRVLAEQIKGLFFAHKGSDAS